MIDEPACDHREELTAYLYDDCDAAERLRLDAHLETCAVCRLELEELQQVRRALGQWAPPERDSGFTLVPRATVAAKPWWSAWRVPLAAAASILVLAGAAGLAHVEVRYGPEGVVVRTGWTSAQAAPAASATPDASTAPTGTASDLTLPTAVAFSAVPLTQSTPAFPRANDAELSAFEARIEHELKGHGNLPSQAGLLQQVQAMVQASEQRQQRQFALRLSEAVHELESQRRADLVRIDQSFGQIEGTTGAAVAQQRELWNYLVRVAQHPQ